MPGPRPTPDHIKDTTGSRLPRNNKSPRCYIYRNMVGVPKLRHIERETYAKELWDEVTPDIVAAGLLTRANLSTWGNYCLAYASACHAQDDVFDNGRWVMEPKFNKNGDVSGEVRKVNPSISQARDSRLEMLRYAVEFGITPAAATRVQAEPSDERKTDDFADFMNTAEEEIESNASTRTN